MKYTLPFFLTLLLLSGCSTLPVGQTKETTTTHTIGSVQIVTPDTVNHTEDNTLVLENDPSVVISYELYERAEGVTADDIIAKNDEINETMRTQTDGGRITLSVTPTEIDNKEALRIINQATSCGNDCANAPPTQTNYHIRITDTQWLSLSTWGDAQGATLDTLIQTFIIS